MESLKGKKLFNERIAMVDPEVLLQIVNEEILKKVRTESNVRFKYWENINEKTLAAFEDFKKKNSLIKSISNFNKITFIVSCTALILALYLMFFS